MLDDRDEFFVKLLMVFEVFCFVDLRVSLILIIVFFEIFGDGFSFVVGCDI